MSNFSQLVSVYLLRIIFRFRKFISDTIYLKLCFRLRMGKNLNLKNPQSFNEKLQWLKLYDRNPRYTQLVDKYQVKEYITSLIGKDYIVPTIGIWEKLDDVDWEHLPNQFVIKTTHGGGGNGVVICKDKNVFDINAAKLKIQNSLNSNIFWNHREWPYKNVKPRIIAEQLLVPQDGDLKDYKVLCFGGIPKLIELHSLRFTDVHTQDFYDTEWNKTDITQGGYSLSSQEVFEKPECLSKMLEFSKAIAKGIAHVRVDWYNCNGKLYFGEITFYDGSGYEAFDKFEDDLMLGSWIDLNMAYNQHKN